MMWIIWLAIIVLCVPLNAAKKGTRSTGDATTDSVMVELQTLSNTIETCLAGVEMTVTFEGAQVVMTGRGSFAKPGRIRVERSMPDGHEEVMVSSGGTLWIYDVGSKSVSRINLARVLRATTREADFDLFDPLRPFRGVEWTSIRHTGLDTLDGKTLVTFTAKPQPSLLSLELPIEITTARLWVHPSDGLLRFVELMDGSGVAIVAHRFRDVLARVDLPPRTFDFIIPAGAYPLDATADVIELFEAFEP